MQTIAAVVHVDFAKARAERNFNLALAQALKPRRVSKATKKAQHAQGVRVAAKLAL